MAQIADCQLEDTWCRCCFASTDWVYSIEDIIVAGVAIAEFLHLRFILVLMKVFYRSLQLRLSCSFLFDLLLHDLGSLGHCLSSSHLLRYKSQELIFLAEAC
jgi:hypothetical protein